MPSPLDCLNAADPTDLEGLRSLLDSADPEGRLAPIGMQAIDIGSGVLESLPDTVAECTARGHVALLTDRTPMQRGADDLKPLAFELLASRFEVTQTMLGPLGRELRADEETVEQATTAAEGAGAVVVVGSGTITDVAKAATMARGTPLVVVQTAASVNGFADDRSVLLRHGTKRTVETRWPDVLLVDLEVLASAPTAMNLAGLGDLFAVFTAPADWYLASLMGLDDAYHPAAAALYRDRTERLSEHSDAIARGKHTALDELARLLTLSGIAMGIAGTTAPSSGAEHVISHLIDMAREQDGTPLALHGAQVGVATLPVALAWSLLLEEVDVAALDLRQLLPSAERMQRLVREAFDAIDPSGAVSEECWKDYERKLAGLHGRPERLRTLSAAWERHRADFSALATSGARLARALREGGAPTRFSALVPPVAPARARWALANAHLMRNRFYVSDLLAIAGLWDDDLLEGLLRKANTVGAGL